MDASGEVADLMVKESIQLTEESIKLLAAGCKNLTAFLYALAKDNKKLVGKTSMKRLLRDEKELKTFCIKAEDLEDFRKYAKPNILFAAIRDTKKDDGLVALVNQHGLCIAGQSVHATPGLSCPHADAGGHCGKKSRPPHSTRELLTRAREWLDTIEDEPDDEDY